MIWGENPLFSETPIWIWFKFKKSKSPGKSHAGSVDLFFCTVLFEKGWFPARYVAGGHLIVRLTKHGKNWSDLHGTQISASDRTIRPKKTWISAKAWDHQYLANFYNYNIRFFFEGEFPPLKTDNNSWANDSFWGSSNYLTPGTFPDFNVTKSPIPQTTESLVGEAFWSVLVISVSAALINYNKYLMSPTRPRDAFRSLAKIFPETHFGRTKRAYCRWNSCCCFFFGSWCVFKHFFNQSQFSGGFLVHMVLQQLQMFWDRFII